MKRKANRIIALKVTSKHIGSESMHKNCANYWTHCETCLRTSPVSHAQTPTIDVNQTGKGPWLHHQESPGEVRWKREPDPQPEWNEESVGRLLSRYM